MTEIEKLEEAWYLVREARNILGNAYPSYQELDGVMGRIQDSIKTRLFYDWCKENSFHGPVEIRILSTKVRNE